MKNNLDAFVDTKLIFNAKSFEGKFLKISVRILEVLYCILCPNKFSIQN